MSNTGTSESAEELTFEESRKRDAERPPLTKWILGSYGAPATPLAMVGLPMAVFLPAVYADSEGFGLGLAFVGIVLVLARLFDGVTDPVVGLLSDRVRTRWGRRKPFILLGTPDLYTWHLHAVYSPHRVY